MSTQGKVITCKAAVVWAAGEPLKIETIQVDPPGPKEVRIKIVSTGLCHTDLHAQDGSFIPLFPIILGHEGAGIVESIGAGVTSVKPGDKVLTFFTPSCQECDNCKLPSRTCEMYGVDGYPRFKLMADGKSRFSCNGKLIYHFTGNSTFSEYTVCPEISIAKINDKANLDTACLYACGFPTGFGAVRKVANVLPGTSVGVWGLGGVGLCAVIGAKHAGAKTIIGIDTNPAKFEAAKKYGCTDFINPLEHPGKSVADVVKEKTGKHMDYAIQCAGNIRAINDAIECGVRSAGTVVVVGISDQNVSFPAGHFLSGVKIDGCFIGGYNLRKEVPELVDRYLKGEFDTDAIITHTFKLDEINDAYKLLHEGKCLRSRILM